MRQINLQEIREWFLDRLDDRGWDDEDPRLDYGSPTLPFFAAAFGQEQDPAHRARLVRVI